MPVNVTLPALTLLRYLHEHAGVSGGRIGLNPRVVMRALRISMTRLNEDAASLTADGLAGVRFARRGADDRPSSTCSAIWVTGKGEAYLKQLQL